jgi:predicted SAM-dependent methyltransferase
MNLIRKTFNKCGFEVKRLDLSNDIDDYIRLYGEENADKKKFYNVGAGNFYHPCWTNIDNGSDAFINYNANFSKHIQYDFFSLQKLPVDVSSAELIYTSHAIEHVTDKEVQHFFNEAFRALKKTGLLRIVTPNIDIEYYAWKNNDRDYWYWINDFSEPAILKGKNLKIAMNKATTAQLFLEGFASTASTIVIEGGDYRITDEELAEIFKTMPYPDALNYCISKCSVEIQKKFSFHHINWFNKDKLFSMLKQAGFENIYHSAYGQSFAPVMRNLKYFDQTLPKVSLYIEAIK